ncbi:MAG: LUD domain-containing protein, partial [Dehalococcoidales bacterium]|nr:LUD domain-containing protein [Dehalococcoidales bacterium]
MSEFSDYKKELMDAAHDRRIRLALSRAVKSYRGNTADALKKFPHSIKMAEEVRAIKEASIPRMEELAQQACEAIESNHGKGYIARTAEDALKIIGDLVGKDKLIVKGKSMTGEEIEIREHLEHLGNQVFETDLGEFIIQKLNSRPMHIVSPAVHVP